jgi:hypothetical protein
MQEDNPRQGDGQIEAAVEFEAAEWSAIGYAESIAKTLPDG